MRQTDGCVVVGLSGGVDSTIAAWLLKRQGFRVVGVTFALAETGEQQVGSSCCSPTALARAKTISDRLGVPHYTIDLTEGFRKNVVDYFVSGYSAGVTPNPCAKCNSTVRFPALVEIADRLGADFAATGHYARLAGPHRRLSRARDPRKDQSYVLAEVDPALLQRCVFPLGEMTKSEVRRVCADIGMERLVSEESQDICFIDGTDYRDFLKERLGTRPGRLVDAEGVVLGEHQGTYNFTIGQRKGLGHAGGSPLYVTSLDAKSGEVVVGPQEGRPVAKIVLSVSAVHREAPRKRVSVQVRSMGSRLAGTMQDYGVVVLDRPTSGVAMGQTGVVYDGDDVVLGGTITWAGPLVATAGGTQK